MKNLTVVQKIFIFYSDDYTDLCDSLIKWYIETYLEVLKRRRYLKLARTRAAKGLKTFEGGNSISEIVLLVVSANRQSEL